MRKSRSLQSCHGVKILGEVGDLCAPSWAAAMGDRTAWARRASTMYAGWHGPLIPTSDGGGP